MIPKLAVDIPDFGTYEVIEILFRRFLRHAILQPLEEPFQVVLYYGARDRNILCDPVRIPLQCCPEEVSCGWCRHNKTPSVRIGAILFPMRCAPTRGTISHHYTQNS